MEGWKGSDPFLNALTYCAEGRIQTDLATEAAETVGDCRRHSRYVLVHIGIFATTQENFYCYFCRVYSYNDSSFLTF